MTDKPFKMGDLLGVTDLAGEKDLYRLLREIQVTTRRYHQDKTDHPDQVGDLHPQPEMRIVFCCLLEALAWSRASEMPFSLLQDVFLAINQNSTDVVRSVRDYEV